MEPWRQPVSKCRCSLSSGDVLIVLQDGHASEPDDDMAGKQRSTPPGDVEAGPNSVSCGPATPQQLPVMELKQLAALATQTRLPLRARILAASVKSLRGPIKFKADTGSGPVPLDRCASSAAVDFNAEMCTAAPRR